MKFLTALIFILTASVAYGGGGTFPKGPVVKQLKNTIEFKTGQTRIYSNETDDPTA